MKILKVLLGVSIGVLVSTGLLLLNRDWIAPATAVNQECCATHPLAKDFSLTSLEGDTISLKAYRGKVVLLNFWATWCGPCRMEIPGLENLQSKYGDRGLRVVGMDVISEDNAKDVRKFDEQFKMNYPVVLADDKIGDSFGGLVGTPTSVLIGCDGRIYGKFVGYTDERIFEQKVSGLLATCKNS